MSKFPDLGHWMLQELSKSFSVEKEDIGADARLKKGPVVLETESYRVNGLGHFCILRMNAMLGLMKMETIVLASTEKDVPLLNLDRVSVMGKDTQIAELYDTQLEPWPQAVQDAFQQLKERDADLPEQAGSGPHWYDELLYPCSYHKAGKGIAGRLTDAGRGYADAFVSLLTEAPSCDAAEKQAKVGSFAETLLTKGGPAVDSVTKMFGPETARRLVLHHMYGSGGSTEA